MQLKHRLIVSFLALIAITAAPLKFYEDHRESREDDHAFLSRVHLATADAQSPCTQTTNVGFQLPNIGNTTNWGNCINYDIAKLDLILGGTQPIPQNAGQPTISASTNYTTQNISSTALTNFIGGYVGQSIRLFCGPTDTFTTMGSGANVSLGSPWSCATSSSISLTLVGSVWVETGRWGGGGSGGSSIFQSFQFGTNTAISGNSNYVQLTASPSAVLTLTQTGSGAVSNPYIDTIALSVQGTDSKLLSAGTVTGTGVSLCTDANGGATTSGCPAGGGVSAVTASNPLSSSGGATPNITCPTCAVTSSPLNQFASTTPTQLASIITSVTGTGSLVFSASPTLTSPNIGVATATSITLGSGGPVIGASGSTISLGAGASLTNAGVLTVSSCTGCTNLPTIFYQLVAANGTSQTARQRLNLVAGTNMTVACADDPGTNSSDCTLTSSATAGTAFSAITAATNSNAGNFIASGNSWNFSGATAFTLPTAGAQYPGSSSGTITLVAQAAAGTATVNLPSAAGTLVDVASGPLTISAAGALSISTATTGALGVVQLATDLGGTGTAPHVIGLEGIVLPTLAASTGVFYDNNGTIQLATLGTVTSVSGTANQISVATGTTTPVISFPSAVTFPGSVSIPTLTVTTALTIPGSAGAVPTADGALAVNTTTHALVTGSNGTTIVEAAAATGTNTATTCTNQVITAISAIAIPTCSTLTSSSLPATLVYNNQANTYTSGAQTITTGASLTFSGSGTINASTLNGATFASPGAIGGTTPAAGTFTALSANTSFVLNGSSTLTAVKGTDVFLMSAGTVTGTGATLCVDSLGGATTSSCNGVTNGGTNFTANGLLIASNGTNGAETMPATYYLPAGGNIQTAITALDALGSNAILHINGAYTTTAQINFVDDTRCVSIEADDPATTVVTLTSAATSVFGRGSGSNTNVAVGCTVSGFTINANNLAANDIQLPKGKEWRVEHMIFENATSTTGVNVLVGQSGSGDQFYECHCNDWYVFNDTGIYAGGAQPATGIHNVFGGNDNYFTNISVANTLTEGIRDDGSNNLWKTIHPYPTNGSYESLYSFFVNGQGTKIEQLYADTPSNCGVNVFNASSNLNMGLSIQNSSFLWSGGGSTAYPVCVGSTMSDITSSGNSVSGTSAATFYNIQGTPGTQVYEFGNVPDDGQSTLGPLTLTACTGCGNYGADSGSANVLVSASPITSKAAGTVVAVLPLHNNTTTTPTLNVNGLGAQTITKNGTSALVAGDLTTAAIALLISDGTHWQLINPQTSSGGSSVTWAGDLAGSSNTTQTVAALQGTTLTLSSIATGQVLSYNGTAIVNAYAGVNVDAQTTTYTLACPTDRLGEVEFNISAASTLNVPQAGSTTCFKSNFSTVIRNTSSSTAVLTVTLTTSTFQPEGGSSHTLLPNEAMFLYSDAVSSTGNYHAILIPADAGGVNAQSAAYTITAADARKTVIMNCSAPCAATLPATPPNAAFTVNILSIGSTTATISLNGLNYNGSATAPVPLRYQAVPIVTDGSNYFGSTPLVASTNVTFTSNSNGLSISASGGGTPALSAITASAATTTIANTTFQETWTSTLTTNSVAAFSLKEASAATGTGDNELAITTLAGSTSVPLAITDSLTGTQTLPAEQINCTWNGTGVVDACLLISVTNTASGTGSLAFDIQVGGTSQFKVDKAGNATVLTSLIIGTAPTVTAGSAGGVTYTEGTAPTGTTTGEDTIYANATNHCIDVINQTTDVGCIAYLASPTFTGTVTVPTLTISGTVIATSVLGNTSGSAAAPSFTNSPVVSTLSTSGTLQAGGTLRAQTNITLGASNHLWVSSTAPTGLTGFGSTASLSSNNGSAFFVIAATGTGQASALSFTLPSATTAWGCELQDITTPTLIIQQTGSLSATAASFTSYVITTGIATAPSASDIIKGKCSAD